MWISNNRIGNISSFSRDMSVVGFDVVKPVVVAFLTAPKISINMDMLIKVFVQSWLFKYPFLSLQSYHIFMVSRIKVQL